MDSLQSLSNQSFKDILFQLQEPVLFKNILSTTDDSNKWKLLEWSLDDLAHQFGDLKLPFREGKNEKTLHPQWEVETPIKHKTMGDFLNDSLQEPLKWHYFDYKHVKDWFKSKPDILNSFDWRFFQLNLDSSDSTIWIGSKGAHTICHQDTYGCNLVAQTHGRKLWLLFSPECSGKMNPTRIPYEESTIYSKYNFFTPNIRELDAIKNMPDNAVKMVILEPNDVLYVPNGWWHYVESLETSLSVNVWIPVPFDSNARLKEALVHLIINTIGNGLPKNEETQDSSLSECIQFVQTSLEECNNLHNNRSNEPPNKKRKCNLSETFSWQKLQKKYKDHMQPLINLNSENISNFMKKNDISTNDSFEITEEAKEKESKDSSKLDILENVVDTFCHSEVILKVIEILTNKFNDT